MTTANYALSGDETTTLNSVLDTAPYTNTAAQIVSATAALAGLAEQALERAQKRVDLLTRRQNMMLQSAYASVLTARNPAVTVPPGSMIDRQTIDGQDTLVVTTN